MLSSRCNDPFAGKPLREVRIALQKAIEAARIFGQAVFEVWINERAGPAPATANWWEWCLTQARESDLLIVLYNGCAGGSLMQQSGVGICHAEFAAGMEVGPDKVRVVRLEPLPAAKSAPDLAFRDDLNRFRVFSAGATTEDQLRDAVFQSVLDGLRQLAQLGTREVRRGQAWVGPALAWSRLDLATRRNAMRDVVAGALASRNYTPGDTTVFTTIDGQEVLAVCDAIPASVSVAQAREMVGQPFLRDHLLAARLQGVGGPVHFIACQKGITETQAIRQLGYPDVTLVSPPFGVYVADEVQKIQLMFLKDCRDATSTRARVDEAREWLDRAQEAPELRRRAYERAHIVRATASVQRRLPPRVPAARPALPGQPMPAPTTTRPKAAPRKQP